jgi:hypothetical protein
LRNHLANEEEMPVNLLAALMATLLVVAAGLAFLAG